MGFTSPSTSYVPDNLPVKGRVHSVAWANFMKLFRVIQHPEFSFVNLCLSPNMGQYLLLLFHAKGSHLQHSYIICKSILISIVVKSMIGSYIHYMQIDGFIYNNVFFVTLYRTCLPSSSWPA